MIQKYAQPMSPRTQALGAVPSGDEETRLFEEGLTQMAYNVLVSKFPDLMQKVITFKILDSDVNKGSGVGAFVVQQGNDTLYVPVVMADNQIKPVDLFYHKDLNVFLPLNNDWLDEVGQLTLDEMGEPVQTPKTLRRDVDTRHIMIPPTTGRYAYAAARGPLNVNEDLYQMFAKLQQKTASTKPQLPGFLAKAPDSVKEAFVRILKSRPKLAATVHTLYDIDTIAHATTKTASATSNDGGALFVADRDTPPSQFKEVFGDQAPTAFQGMLTRGYVAKDGRRKLNILVQQQEMGKFSVPDSSGFYRVFTADGKRKVAFILVNPRKLYGHDTPETHTYPTGTKRHAARKPDQHDNEYVVVTNDGWYRTSRLMAEYIDGARTPIDSDVFKKLMMGTSGDTPTADSRGIFVKKLGNNFVGTEPFRIQSISTDSDGVRRIKLEYGTTLVTDPKAAKMGLHSPKGGDLMYIPTDARFIKLTGEFNEVPLMRNISDVQKWMFSEFDAMGAQSVTAKHGGAGEFHIDGRTPMSKIAAIKHAALKYAIHFEDAAQLVETAGQRPNGRATAYVLTPKMYEKIAQGPMMDPGAQGGNGAGAPMTPPPPSAAMSAPPGAMPPAGDPSQGGAPPPGGDPSQGGAPPPMPSPLDIAMGEAHTQIQQQMSDFQQQQLALQDKAQTLMMVQQRAQEIAGGGGQVVGQGAPPMPPPGMGDPNAGQPGPGAMQPGPEMMGGGMAGAAGSPAGMPAQGMGGPPPQDPSQQSGAMMATESPSATEIQQQVNPQFLDQAGQLSEQFQDPSVFDAAAIGSMAQSPSFRDMVVDYVPTLERALDNIGRIMLTMWMQESDLKEQIGDDEFSELEDNIRAVFEGLGGLVLQMNRNAIIMDSTAQA
jgi:hypothetical protein